MRRRSTSVAAVHTAQKSNNCFLRRVVAITRSGTRSSGVIGLCVVGVRVHVLCTPRQKPSYVPHLLYISITCRTPRVFIAIPLCEVYSAHRYRAWLPAVKKASVAVQVGPVTCPPLSAPTAWRGSRGKGPRSRLCGPLLGI